MSTIDQLLQHARDYARDFDRGDLPMPPARRLAVVTCMDCRLVQALEQALGLERGDVVELRTAERKLTTQLMRRAADIPNLSAWMVAKTSFFRVPQLTERLLPFSVLVGAMSCYLALSRRNELVVARSAGMSAWQFVAPALIVAFVMG